MTRILVAYASRHGATKGITERITHTLERAGLDVTLERITHDLEAGGYDAYVVGSGAYAFHWMKEATRFVRRNAGLLSTRPVWLFSSGPVGTETVDKNGNDVLVTARPKEFSELAAIVPLRGEQVFFGAYDPDAAPVDLAERFMHGFMRFMPSVRDALPAGDFRDWPAIEAWAQRIALELNAPRVATTAVV
jgi:menaquinone-dependent protoporphyrinogen oxidase